MTHWSNSTSKVDSRGTDCPNPYTQTTSSLSVGYLLTFDRPLVIV